MKKSAVVILMIALFSGSAFAGSCANASKVGLGSSTKASTVTSSGDSSEGTR